MPPDRAAILLSVKPKWWDLIRAGRKTVELRRVTPVDLKPGMPIVWYVSAPVSAIVGEAMCDAIESAKDATGTFRRPGVRAAEEWADCAGMNIWTSDRYWRGAQSPCAIWLRDVREYANEVWCDPTGANSEELRLAGWATLRPPQSFRYLTADELAAIRAAGGENDA